MSPELYSLDNIDKLNAIDIEKSNSFIIGIILL